MNQPPGSVVAETRIEPKTFKSSAQRSSYWAISADGLQ